MIDAHRSQRFGTFPPIEFLPDVVKPTVEKLLTLRTKLLDAQQSVIDTEAQITKAEAEQITKTVDALANGQDATVDSKPVEAAKCKHEQAVRDSKATWDALCRVEVELYAALQAHHAELSTLASDAAEAVRDEYRQAIEQVAATRRGYHDALDVIRFVESARMPWHKQVNLTYVGQRVGDSPYELDGLRSEVDPSDGKTSASGFNL